MNRKRKGTVKLIKSSILTIKEFVYNSYKEILIGKIFRPVTRKIRIIPDFLIIGAGRCGTTSLYNYLIKHPLILPALKKEVHFFDFYYNEKIEKYKTYFPTIIYRNIIRFLYRHRPVTGEATPHYLIKPQIPKKVFKMCPNVKIIILLRNPADRAYSNYKFSRKIGNTRLTFKEEIKADIEMAESSKKDIYEYKIYRPWIIFKGIYINHIKNWREFFPKNQILIIKSENFFNCPQKILNLVFKFLNLPNYNLKVYKKYNSSFNIEMHPKMRKYLIDYFREPNLRLYEYLGRDFGWND